MTRPLDKRFELKPVKLVIWDLDDTFWRGTLSEEPIQYIPENHDIVVELSGRGIVNSICSKNSYQTAMEVLKSHAIWDYFVLPFIDWQPKGPAIQQLITRINLRSENILFIDDNHLNLEEAKYYSPDLQVASPSVIPELLTHDALSGKKDPNLSRLRQYKILEEKIYDQNSMGGSNDEFLRSCSITVTCHENCDLHVERIHELINRTNQLNFTKERLNRDQLLELIHSEDCETKYLKVADKYGDYGICGFYAKKEDQLLQLLFSCRILGMGVEQWLYNKIGCPEMNIKGDTATTVEKGFFPDWIHEVDPISTNDVKSVPGEGRRVFIKGGCDLEQLAGFLSGNLKVTTEFNYQSDKGAPVHTEHTEILRQCGQPVVRRHGEIIDRLFFLDRNAYQSALFASKYDVYIYSALMDYTNGLYRYQSSDWIVPFGDFLMDITRRNNWDYLFDNFSERGLTKEFLVWFSENFNFLGGLSTQRLDANLKWLYDRLPPESLFIVLNGSEIPKPHPIETDRWLHHQTYNQVLERVARKHPRMVICDVRKFVHTSDDITDNIRHYKRRNYFFIAGEIERLIATQLEKPLTAVQKISTGLRYTLLQARDKVNELFSKI